MDDPFGIFARIRLCMVRCCGSTGLLTTLAPLGTTKLNTDADGAFSVIEVNPTSNAGLLALPKTCTRNGTKCLLSSAIVTRLIGRAMVARRQHQRVRLLPGHHLRAVDRHDGASGSIAFSAAAAAWAGVYVCALVAARFASAADRTEWLTWLVADV